MTEWRPVDEVPEYEVSDDGLVRRMTPARGTAGNGRLIARTPQSSGYLLVQLWHENRQHARLVHRLVATAFLGPSEGREVNHRNLDKLDNRVANLEWVTRSENIRHAVAHGVGRGERNSGAKLTEDDVRAIRRLHVEGWGYKRLGRQFGVSWESIRNLLQGRTWSHVA